VDPLDKVERDRLSLRRFQLRQPSPGRRVARDEAVLDGVAEELAEMLVHGGHRARGERQRGALGLDVGAADGDRRPSTGRMWCSRLFVISAAVETRHVGPIRASHSSACVVRVVRPASGPM